MNQTISKLTETDGSQLHKPRESKQKNALIVWEPADYELSWGSQTFDGPHVQVQDDCGNYGVALNEFFSTHEPVLDREDHYIKTVTVRALQVDKTTDIVTVVDGRQEATATVQPGGWVLQNPGGEIYFNTPDEFEKRYEAC